MLNFYSFRSNVGRCFFLHTLARGAWLDDNTAAGWQLKELFTVRMIHLNSEYKKKLSPQAPVACHLNTGGTLDEAAGTFNPSFCS